MSAHNGSRRGPLTRALDAFNNQLDRIDKQRTTGPARAEKPKRERPVRRRPDHASQRPLWRRHRTAGRTERWARPAERHGHMASTAHVQALYPFQASSPLGNRGVLIGRSVYGGAFAIDPWQLYAEGVLQDANLIILGLKGLGKSALLKCYALRQRVFGRRIEVIDRKSEYEGVIAAMGGVTLRLRPGVRINPLERHASQSSRESLLRAVARALLGRDLTPVERVGLSAALAAVDDRHSGRDVIVPDVTAELREPSENLTRELNMSADHAREELRECMLALRDLEVGPLKGMFDGPTTHGAEVWDNPALAIDISQISEHTYGEDENVALAIALISCTSFLDARRRERELRGDASKVVRVNDEAWRALAVPGAADYYNASLKLSRKTGVQYALALHRLTDLSATGDAGSRTQTLAEGLVSECATRIVYRQSAQATDLTTRALQLSSTERELLTRLGQGEALWRVGERGFLVRHLIAAAEWPLVQTDEGMAARAPQVVR